uniref:Amidase domain-containing protein n=1 Tax=Leersia perrieri TaxID=77586 RepID=A0A0D9W1W1_9ORYZ
MANARMATSAAGDHGAFMERFLLPPPPSPPQQLPLHGLTFAIKDIFDIAGRVTGFGNPDWARTHAPAAATSPVVLATLAAGATSLGTTVMDEMAYSINGENAHYGTPTNPCAPGRVPGGSSSGSAVAVAANLVDFSLGTDTGGSVRVPAAYCGIFGLRTSHGLVSTQNVIPMAQMFDTVGWFARDISTLSRVTKVLLPLPDDDTVTVNQPTHVTIPLDCFQILGSPDDRTYQVVNASVAKKFGLAIDNMNLGDFISNNVPSIGKFIAEFSESELPSVPALSVISHVMRGLQRSQFKANHAEWVSTVKPNLGPGLRERIQEAIASGDNESLEDFQAIRAEFKSALSALLKDHGILAIPTVPGPPPMVGMEAAPLENFRARAFSLLSIAGLSGFCQVSIPLGTRNGVPVSVSLMARHGTDHFLLNMAHELYPTLVNEATKAWAS